jgi:predicted TIM-barrel fold metal-dependent hydrolase
MYKVGSDRLVFGTDNPFFPPLHEKDITNVVWPSTAKVYQCIDELDENIRNKILFTNATKILDL